MGTERCKDAEGPASWPCQWPLWVAASCDTVIMQARLPTLPGLVLWQKYSIVCFLYSGNKYWKLKVWSRSAWHRSLLRHHLHFGDYAKTLWLHKGISCFLFPGSEALNLHSTFKCGEWVIAKEIHDCHCWIQMHQLRTSGFVFTCRSFHPSLLNRHIYSSEVSSCVVILI